VVYRGGSRPNNALLHRGVRADARRYHNRVITVIKACTQKEIRIKSLWPTWKRVTIGDAVLQRGTWFRQLYVSSSNCVRRPRFGDTRAMLHARDSNKEEEEEEEEEEGEW